MKKCKALAKFTKSAASIARFSFFLAFLVATSNHIYNWCLFPFHYLSLSLSLPLVVINSSYEFILYSNLNENVFVNLNVDFKMIISLIANRILRIFEVRFFETRHRDTPSSSPHTYTHTHTHTHEIANDRKNKITGSVSEMGRKAKMKSPKKRNYDHISGEDAQNFSSAVTTTTIQNIANEDNENHGDNGDNFLYARSHPTCRSSYDLTQLAGQLNCSGCDMPIPVDHHRHNHRLRHLLVLNFELFCSERCLRRRLSPTIPSCQRCRAAVDIGKIRFSFHDFATDRQRIFCGKHCFDIYTQTTELCLVCSSPVPPQYITFQAKNGFRVPLCSIECLQIISMMTPDQMTPSAPAAAAAATCLKCRGPIFRFPAHFQILSHDYFGTDSSFCSTRCKVEYAAPCESRPACSGCHPQDLASPVLCALCCSTLTVRHSIRLYHLDRQYLACSRACARTFRIIARRVSRCSYCGLQKWLSDMVSIVSTEPEEDDDDDQARSKQFCSFFCYRRSTQADDRPGPLSDHHLHHRVPETALLHCHENRCTSDSPVCLQCGETLLIAGMIRPSISELFCNFNCSSLFILARSTEAMAELSIHYDDDDGHLLHRLKNESLFCSLPFDDMKGMISRSPSSSSRDFPISTSLSTILSPRSTSTIELIEDDDRRLNCDRLKTLCDFSQQTDFPLPPAINEIERERNDSFDAKFPQTLVREPMRLIEPDHRFIETNNMTNFCAESAKISLAQIREKIKISTATKETEPAIPAVNRNGNALRSRASSPISEIMTALTISSVRTRNRSVSIEKPRNSCYSYENDRIRSSSRSPRSLHELEAAHSDASCSPLSSSSSASSSSSSASQNFKSSCISDGSGGVMPLHPLQPQPQHYNNRPMRSPLQFDGINASEKAERPANISVTGGRVAENGFATIRNGNNGHTPSHRSQHQYRYGQNGTPKSTNFVMKQSTTYNNNGNNINNNNNNNNSFTNLFKNPSEMIEREDAQSVQMNESASARKVHKLEQRTTSADHSPELIEFSD